MPHDPPTVTDNLTFAFDTIRTVLAIVAAGFVVKQLRGSRAIAKDKIIYDISRGLEDFSDAITYIEALRDKILLNANEFNKEKIKHVRAEIADLMQFENKNGLVTVFGPRGEGDKSTPYPNIENQIRSILRLYQSVMMMIETRVIRDNEIFPLIGYRIITVLNSPLVQKLFLFREFRPSMPTVAGNRTNFLGDDLTDCDQFSLTITRAKSNLKHKSLIREERNRGFLVWEAWNLIFGRLIYLERWRNRNVRGSQGFEIMPQYRFASVFALYDRVMKYYMRKFDDGSGWITSKNVLHDMRFISYYDLASIVKWQYTKIRVRRRDEEIRHRVEIPTKTAAWGFWKKVRRFIVYVLGGSGALIKWLSPFGWFKTPSGDTGHIDSPYQLALYIYDRHEPKTRWRLEEWFDTTITK